MLQKQHDLELTGKQYDFYTADEKFCLFSAGIGSGKSFVGSHFAIRKISEDKSPGLIGANTYKQLHNATLATLFSEFDKFSIPFKYNQNKGILKVYDNEIFCYSLENYDSIRGIQIGWFWLDETRDTREQAFKVILGRLRHPSAQKLEGRLTSSPSGFDWMYDYFAGDKKTKDFKLIEGATFENPYLPDEYVESLRDAYDDKVYQQEVLGKFINITQGQIYYGFDRTRHVKPLAINDRYPLWIGMDFNINPMTATVCQDYDNTIYVVDEFFLQSSDTAEIAEEIKKKYGTGLRIIPDSTGKRTQTSSSGFSDHDILERHGFKVMGTRNPFRIDRYNCVNNLFDKDRLLIDAKCVKLIRDLEQVSYKEGSSQPDVTKDKSITHISDALGYLCYYHYGIVSTSASIGMLSR